MSRAFRAYLSDLNQLEQRIWTLAARRCALRAECQQMTANYQASGHGGGCGGAKDATLAALADAETELEQLTKELSNRESRLMSFLGLLYEDERCGLRDMLLLRNRYLLRLEWSDVKDTLDKKGFAAGCMRTVYNWHRAALDHADILWEETYGLETSN